MNEVKRYNFYGDCDRATEENGEYVETADFESERAARIAAETKLAELEDEILNAQNADSYDFLMNLQDKIAKARSRS